MRTGAQLSEAACDILYRTALRMAQKEIREKKIYHDDISGIIYTDYEPVSLGTFAGYVFDAEVETPNGKKTEIRFIAQSSDLEEDNQEVYWFGPKREEEEDEDDL